jgi:hypothetical protein
MNSNEQDKSTARDAAETRRRFLKKAGTIAIAAPVMETLSREGLFVRSAHAQTGVFDGFGGPMDGPILTPI